MLVHWKAFLFGGFWIGLHRCWLCAHGSLLALLEKLGPGLNLETALARPSALSSALPFSSWKVLFLRTVIRTCLNFGMGKTCLRISSCGFDENWQAGFCECISSFVYFSPVHNGSFEGRLQALYAECKYGITDGRYSALTYER